jgi:hypothetical protein
VEGKNLGTPRRNSNPGSSSLKPRRYDMGHTVNAVLIFHCLIGIDDSWYQWSVFDITAREKNAAYSLLENTALCTVSFCAEN